MAGVHFRNVTKVFGKNVVAVNRLDLDVKDGEFMVLVGPSGCGKTTALRMLAGLEEATEGEILIGDRKVNDVPPKDRDIAMVFQNYALYPHMTVEENISFGLNLRELGGFFWQMTHLGEAKRRRADIQKRVQEAATMLGIEQLLHRRPKELSGGQRQRVALGRAIVRNPNVYLMDEPLSNLDAKLRIQTRAELIRLHRQLGVTTIYVTHDQVEAMTMGSRIAVMKDGVLQQCDEPETVYRRPANKFVAGFIGSPPMNFLEGELKDGVVYAETMTIPLSGDHPARKRANGKIIVGVRPEAILEAGTEARDMPHAQFHAEVDVIEPLGATFTAYLTLGKTSLQASLSSESPIQEGQKTSFMVPVHHVHFFDPETEVAIRS